MKTPQQEVGALAATWLAGDTEGKMYDVCAEEPETAWLAILEILKIDLTDDQISLLAAGPLEDLLVWHGSAFIDRVEEEAKSNVKFNHLLGGIWRREMSSEIWVRIERARKEVW